MKHNKTIIAFASIVLAMGLVPLPAFASEAPDGGLAASSGLAVQAGVIASGASGTCEWLLDADGHLTVRPANGGTGMLGIWARMPHVPWSLYISKVKSASFEGTVKVDCCPYMFSEFKSLEWVDLSGLDASNATSVDGMFSNCVSLREIVVSEGWRPGRLAEDRGLFYGCTALVGGNGTRYDAAHVGGDYARIDTASAPGYFTDKAAAPSSAALQFSDVPPTHWVASEGWLGYVTGKGLMSGYSGTTKFGPDDPLTRGQVATILFRYANPDSSATTDASAYAANATRFKDNASGKYYTAAMNWAYEQGIFTGDASSGYTTVRPDDGITRQELGTVLYRFAVSRGASKEGASAASYASAPDAGRVADWASEGMGWCYAKRVLTGNASTGALDPQGGATRAHMAKMITVVTRDVLG